MPVAFFELRRQRYAHLKGSTNLPCWLMALKPLCSKKHSMVVQCYVSSLDGSTGILA